MKIYRDQRVIANKERTGRRFSMIGMAILFVGLIASFAPTRYPDPTVQEATSSVGQFFEQYWGIISFAALPLGFISASFGTYYIARYARRRWPGGVAARPDEVVERSLKGFDDKYSLFIYSLPVGYALLTPFALLTFAVRSDKGRVTVKGDRWREGWNFSRIFTFFAREGVGNPPGELAEQERKMREFLAQGGPELEATPIEGAVLFLNSEAAVQADAPTVPVLRADQLKDYIRKRAKEVKAPPALMRQAAAYLQENNGATEPA
jgi:hypothetical protein